MSRSTRFFGGAVIAILGFVFSATPVFAAVTFGDSSSGSVFSDTTLTISHDASGDSVLLVSFNSRLACSSTDITGVSVTFNGDALTEVKSSTYAGGGECAHMHLWKSTAPDSGTYDVVISWTGSAAVVGHVYSFAGADDIDTVSESIGGDSAWDISATLTSDDMLFGTVGQSQSTPDMTSTADNVLESNTSPDYVEILSATETGSGTVTISGTSGGASAVRWGVPILASAGGSPPASSEIVFATSTGTVQSGDIPFLLGVILVLLMYFFIWHVYGKLFNIWPLS